jgi:hypothetical protein
MATHGYSRYHTGAVWDEEYRDLDYIQEQFNDPDKLAEWQQMGYQNVATGYMCDMRSPQPVWNPYIVGFFAQRGWRDIGTSYYRMGPGCILPNHSDLYKRYVNIYDLQGLEHTIRRAIVFLENWKSGHYLEVAGDAITGWAAGDIVEWSYDAPHLAANMGLENRYTLQVTGHI